jgi:putative flippase GtrA
VFRRKENIRSLASFLLVGGVTAGLYFGLLALFLEVIGLDYKLGVSAAYLLAISFHFFSNRHLTFRSGHARIVPQVVRYLIVAFVNYLLTLGVVFVVVDRLRSSAYVGVMASILLTLVFGYAGSKIWVFRHREQSHE